MSVAELDAKSFKEIITGSSVLVDFYATWCGPCRNMLKELEKFSTEHPEIRVGKVNIESDENKELAAMFDVSTIPSLFFFRDGQLVTHLTGYFPARVLAEKLSLQ